MATQEQQMSIQEQKNALKESMKNHKNALKGSLKEQQAALEKSLKESTEAAKEQASGFIAFLQRQLDRVVSPETRDQAYERMQEFAKERPFLFTFLVAQVLTCAVPVALFAAFTSSVLVLSLGAAVLFTFFWLGVAVMVLVPTLFVTVTIGAVLFCWVVAIRFAYTTLPAVLKNLFAGSREAAEEKYNNYSDAIDRAKKAIKDSANRNGTNGTHTNGATNGTHEG
ncbi:hypothetical protein PspLS_05958 [Pyricularia sp. CBS 133598]|nr:hypothetical protein PspLS_05958 [Pyricularia sp. CBS 133598]